MMEPHRKYSRSYSASRIISKQSTHLLTTNDHALNRVRQNSHNSILVNSHHFGGTGLHCRGNNFVTQFLDSNQKSAKIFKRLFEWSHRAKTIEVSRHVQKALDKEDTEFTNDTLKNYLRNRCSDLISASKYQSQPNKEKKRITAMLDYFLSELDFLYNRLLVLKNVFKEPLKCCQVEGVMITLEPDLLFGNLDELCHESFSFCLEFAALLEKSLSADQFCCTNIISQLFKKFTESVSAVSAYQAYCLNYRATLEYLETIRKTEERFVEYEKVCCLDSRCNRLQLQDFLIAPLHRITRLPIHLKEILKYTTDFKEQTIIKATVSKIDEALKSIDDSIRWLHNFEELQDLQTQLIWPPISDMDNRMYIPEFMRLALAKQFCEKNLVHPRRKLIYEGPLTLTESQRSVEMYAFLFNDLFVLTKQKKATVKTKSNKLASSPIPGSSCNLRHIRNKYIVHREPVPLDCCVLCDVPENDSKNHPIKHGFVVLQLSRFSQAIALYTLHVPTKESKDCWMNKFQESIDNYESIEVKDMMKCTSELLLNSGIKSCTNSANTSPQGSQSNLSPDAHPTSSYRDSLLTPHNNYGR